MARTAPPAARPLPAPEARRAERPEPAATPRRRMPTAPPVWRELLLVALFYTAYTLTRLILVQDGTGPAYENAYQILNLERALGMDVELWLNETLLAVPWLARTANVFYATMHFIVTIAVVVWLYRFRPDHYRWLRTALIVATGAALIGFWLYPLAPPRFLHSEGFVDPVTALHSLGLYSSDASGAFTNQYAAMPSMHAGWALWCGIVMIAFARWRWVKVLGALYPGTTVVVIIATANHYILDAVVGNALVGAALWMSWALYRRRPRSLLVARTRVSLLLARPAPGATGSGSTTGPPARVPVPAPAAGPAPASAPASAPDRPVSGIC